MTLLLLYRPRTLAGTGVGGGGGWVPWAHRELIKLLWEDSPRDLRLKRKKRLGQFGPRFYSFAALTSEFPNLPPETPLPFPLSEEALKERIEEINKELLLLARSRGRSQSGSEIIVSKPSSPPEEKRPLGGPPTSFKALVGVPLDSNPSPLELEKRRLEDEEELLLMLLSLIN